MWVFLNNAFLSIVEDKDDWHDLWVRARLRGDIERVFPDAEVAETPAPADYRFRAKLPRGTVERAMMLAARGINYTNFKKSVLEEARHDAYLRVWNEMWLAQQAQFPDEPVVGLRLNPVKLPPTTVRKRPVNRRGKKPPRPRSSRR